MVLHFSDRLLLVLRKIQVASIGLYVQTFFCHRLWTISKKNQWIVGTIVVVLLFAYVSCCVAVRYILRTTYRLSLIVFRIDILHIERRQRRSPHRYLVYAFVTNTSVLPFHLQSFLVAAHLSSVFGLSPTHYILLQLNRSTFPVAGDFLITLSTAYFLLQSRKEALPPSVFLPLIQGSYITSSITGQPALSTLSCALLSKQQLQLHCGMPFLRANST